MYRILLTLTLIISLLSVKGADIDSAKKLYNNGKYDEAVEMLEQLVAKTPKDAAINYYLGASYFKKGYYKAAINFLKVAENANWPVAARDLADIYIRTYDFDAASDNLDRWEAMLDKAKKPYPDELIDMRNKILMARNMLERVEKIEIVDVIDVDSVEFFRHYRLSPDAGELLEGAMLPDEYAAENPKVVFQPQTGKELFWGRLNAEGGTDVVVADVWDDGTISEPRSLGDAINDTGTADFPFVVDDGYTIYYGAKGDDSLGGYDIFMTRRSADGDLLQPQNIGMPYNSPYNDFMMVIDETNNLGWWASDRNHTPGRITIYTFVPSKMRVNHNPESPKIREFALLNDVKPTGDLDERLVEEATVQDEDEDTSEDFYLPMPNGKVYTKLSDFKNSQARQAMKSLLKRMFDLEVMQAQIDSLREEYGRGNKKIADQILTLEKNIKEAPSAIERLTNQIISLEIR